MTDHLEPYRRMARSIRFFPPVSLTKQSQESVAMPVTPASVVPSQNTVPERNASAVSQPPIDPSEHAAALVHEAVRKPTALPVTYTILENIGDRISRLTTPKAAPITLQSKIPQPPPSTSAIDSASKSAIDPDHAATLIYEAVRQPTRLPDSYEIPENIGDRISRLSGGKPVDYDSTSTEIPQPDAYGTPARPIEPQSSETDLKKSVDDADLESATSVTGVGEAPTVAQNDNDDSEVAIEPIEETTDAAATAVVAESVADEEPKSDDAVATVAQPHEVEQIANDANNTPELVVTEPVTATDTLVAQPEDAPPTLLERVSSVIETVTTAFKNSDTKQQDDIETVTEPSSSESTLTETSTTDTVEPLKTNAEAEAPIDQSPSLLERVSSVVEAVTTVFKNPDAQHQDSELEEPSQTTDVVSETPTSPTPQTPTISAAPPVEADTTPLKDSEAVSEAALADKNVEKTGSKSDSIETEDEPPSQVSPTKTAEVEGSTTSSGTDTSNSTSSAKRSKRKTRGKGFGSV